MFGPFQVLVGGADTDAMKGRAGHLLACLVLRHGEDVPRQTLARMIWSDDSIDNAGNNLSQTLIKLKKALGSQAYRILSPSRSTLKLELRVSVQVLGGFGGVFLADDRGSAL